ncbi:MAG: aminotransferase class V-fold PLP-dependent enzyme [Candidatus Ancillula trichonymphae]|jgi:cysteine desulfurase/selenocysteine lyase|nr:aminotransferase class V-fold PLP-dependent enzyme [Candidatus Ancillula trichonymphae]
MNVLDVRSEFPMLEPGSERRIGTGDAKLVYLDSAATALKPKCVIAQEFDFYSHNTSAAGRGVHTLANEAGEAIECARRKLVDFALSSDVADVEKEKWTAVFTSGATMGLNMLSLMFLLGSLNSGENKTSRFQLDDKCNIILSRAEHHSNIVPWQQVSKITGAQIRYLDLLNSGELDLEQLNKLVDENTKVLSVSHASNVTGVVHEVDKITAHLDKFTAGSSRPIVILDACQSAPHIPLELDIRGVDFAVVSAHKVYGPSGVGAVLGQKDAFLDAPVVMSGGGMVEQVDDFTTTFQALPNKYEPGSFATAQIHAFAAALDFVSEIGFADIRTHEKNLTSKLLEVHNISGVRILGDGVLLDNRLGLVAFELAGVHPHDLGNYLDELGIAVRVGHHCAQLVHRWFGVQSSTRASLGIYNTTDDVDALIGGIESAKRFFGV